MDGIESRTWHLFRSQVLPSSLQNHKEPWCYTGYETFFPWACDKRESHSSAASCSCVLAGCCSQNRRLQQHKFETRLLQLSIVKLQRVQNTLARVIFRQGKFDHITPVLKHWLPIEKRITFKLATLSYNIKSTGQPAYLREPLSHYQPIRTLWSSSKHFFTVNVAVTVLTPRGFKHSAVSV